MSRISNNDFIPGATVSSTAVASKFTDVQTATGSLDETNLANGSVDTTHLSNTSLFVASSGVKWESSGFAASYGNDVTNTALQPIDTIITLDFNSAPTTVAIGDLLRVYYQLWVRNTTLSGDVSGEVAIAETGGIFWALYVEYASQAGPTGWLPLKGQEVPGLKTFKKSTGTLSNHFGFDFGSSAEEKQSTLMMIPHGFITYKPAVSNTNGSTSPVTVLWDDSNSEQRNYSSMRAYAHEATEAYTMYGLRLRLTGVYQGSTIEPSAGVYNGALALITGSHPVGGSGVANDTFTISFSNGQLAYMHMKKE